MSEELGAAAGAVWEYLNDNGEVSVNKLTKETDLDTKMVQRAIGWLAKEDKLSFSQKGRTEIVALK
jgi:predicted transcriptional regulator